MADSCGGPAALSDHSKLDHLREVRSLEYEVDYLQNKSARLEEYARQLKSAASSGGASSSLALGSTPGSAVLRKGTPLTENKENGRQAAFTPVQRGSSRLRR
jgi:hypothetical protein